MSTLFAYNRWSAHYDSTPNKTRDLEARAQQDLLGDRTFERALEWGCGTGKNTQWLAAHSKSVVALDFSEQMLQRARKKVSSEYVEFLQGDLDKPWPPFSDRFDLITFSLVLEHIENLEPVFARAAECLKPGGLVYMGELHPFKQYAGSKAGLEIEFESITPVCFVHHFSEYIKVAEEAGLRLLRLNEYYDECHSQTIPRILGIIFGRNN